MNDLDRFHETGVLDDYRELDKMDECRENGCSGGKGCIWYDYHETTTIIIYSA